MKKYTIGLITGALLAVSAMMFMGAQNKNLGDITAESIILVGGDGSKTIIVGGALETHNTDGKKTAFLGTAVGGGGVLTTYNADGQETVYLGTAVGGGGGILSTQNADGKTTVYLGTNIEGSGALYAFNDDGKETAYLGTNIDRSGYVTTYNANGNRNAYLGFGKGGGRLITFETDGKKTIYLGTNIEGSGGHLETFNKHEVQTGYFGTIKNNDGVAALFDRYGDEGWSASGKQ